MADSRNGILIEKKVHTTGNGSKMRSNSKKAPALPKYYRGVFKAVARVSRETLIERFGKECFNREDDKAPLKKDKHPNEGDNDSMTSQDFSSSSDDDNDSVIVSRSPLFDYDMRLYQKTLAERARIAKEEAEEAAALKSSAEPDVNAGEEELPTKSIFERETELTEVDLKHLDDKITSMGKKVKLDRQTEVEYKQNMEAIRQQKKEKIERKLKMRQERLLNSQTG